MECKINVLTSKKKVMKYNNLSIFKLKNGEFVNQIVEEWLKFWAVNQRDIVDLISSIKKGVTRPRVFILFEQFYDSCVETCKSRRRNRLHYYGCSSSEESLLRLTSQPFHTSRATRGCLSSAPRLMAIWLLSPPPPDKESQTLTAPAKQKSVELC
jgi:hypothetical protein